jgi:hypothetical protein
MRGGYAYVLDTGKLGIRYFAKQASDPSDWNLFASPTAACLAVNGYRAVRDKMVATMIDTGATVRQESVNRVDLAVDLFAPGFRIDLDRFTAPSHSKWQPHWGDAKTTHQADPYQPKAVLRAREVESLTIGKLPNRQVITYHKGREVLERHNRLMPAIWGLEDEAAPLPIWRVELRMGRVEIKERRNMKTFAHLERGMPAAFKHMAERVRYLAPDQTDSNVSRQVTDPFWQAVQAAIEEFPFEEAGPVIDHERAAEVLRLQAIDTRCQMIVGNAAGFAVASGMAEDRIATELPAAIQSLLTDRITDPKGGFDKKLVRAREKMAFLTA